MMRVSALLLAFCATSAAAKCPIETSYISGQVTSSSGVPVADAIVTVTWAGTTHWGQGTQAVRTNADGSFATAFAFNTLSGETGLGDECEGLLTLATLRVTRTGYRAQELPLQFVDRRTHVKLVLSRDEG
jgi:hypothetical protein